jgi:hypothetical protein
MSAAVCGSGPEPGLTRVRGPPGGRRDMAVDWFPPESGGGGRGGLAGGQGPVDEQDGGGPG